MSEIAWRRLLPHHILCFLLLSAAVRRFRDRLAGSETCLAEEQEVRTGATVLETARAGPAHTVFLGPRYLFQTILSRQHRSSSRDPLPFKHPSRLFLSFSRVVWSSFSPSSPLRLPLPFSSRSLRALKHPSTPSTPTPTVVRSARAASRPFRDQGPLLNDSFPRATVPTHVDCLHSV